VKSLAGLVVAVACLCAAAAPDRQRLVVASFDEQGVPAGMGDVVADMLIRSIDSPSVELLERRQVRRVLEEQAFASSDLTQPGEAVRYGRLADTRFVLVGTVYRLDGEYIVSARMVDSATGIVQESARAVVQFRTVDEMASRVAELARALGLRVGPTLPTVSGGMPAPGLLPPANAGTQPAPAAGQPVAPAPREGAPSTVRDYLEQVGDPSAPTVAVAAPGNVRTVRAGEDIRFSIRSERDGFLSLFVVDAQGRVGVLLPNDRAGSMPVRAGQVVSVPRDTPFALRAQAPFGPTRIKAIVTPQPVSLAGSANAGEALRQVELGAAVQGAADGGAAARAGWSSAELEFLVVPAGASPAPGTAPAGAEPPSAPALPPAAPVPGAGAPGDGAMRARDAAFLVADAFERTLESAREPGPSESAILRWPLRSPFAPAFDLGWSPQATGELPAIAVIDADFDPDDPNLVRAFAAIAGTQREELRAEIRRNGPAPFRHGNRVASLIAGEAPWLPSVLPGARIVPVRITTSIDAPGYRAERGGAGELLGALRAALGAGCRVVNLSLSVPLEGDELRSFAADPVWDELERAGVVVVCAAGNGLEDLDAEPRYPACLDRRNVLCVGAVGPDGRLARWGDSGSARGARSVDVMAPGSSVAVSDGGGRAGLADGTSYACAFAAGAAALLLAQSPGMPAAEAVDRLVAGARRTPELSGTCRGGLLAWPAAAH
jgi:TolB-like protein